MSWRQYFTHPHFEVIETYPFKNWQLLKMTGNYPPLKGRVHIPSSWIWVGLWLLQPLECGRKDTVGLPTPGRKRPCSSCLLLLESEFWEASCHIEMWLLLRFPCCRNLVDNHSWAASHQLASPTSFTREPSQHPSSWAFRGPQPHLASDCRPLRDPEPEPPSQAFPKLWTPPPN